MTDWSSIAAFAAAVSGGVVGVGGLVATSRATGKQIDAAAAQAAATRQHERTLRLEERLFDARLEAYIGMNAAIWTFTGEIGRLRQFRVRRDADFAEIRRRAQVAYESLFIEREAALKIAAVNTLSLRVTDEVGNALLGKASTITAVIGDPERSTAEVEEASLEYSKAADAFRAALQAELTNLLG